MNLVSVSTVTTPPAQRQRQALAKQRRATGAAPSDAIARPASAEEFLALDFSSRCAIAGLQLGNTKVFLRREAFDRIEALRARKFGKSAAAIQRIVRGNQARDYVHLLRDRLTCAAATIQRAYRDYVDRLFFLEMNKVLIPAAVAIQSVARGANARTRYFGTLYGVMRIQALVRGGQARKAVLRMLNPNMASPVHSLEGPLCADRDASFGSATFIGDITSATPRSMALVAVPDDKAQAVVEISSDWIQLRNLVADENWAAVEGTLDQHPELAEEVDPTNG